MRTTAGPVAVLGGHGKTGRAVCDALGQRGAVARPLGRSDADALVDRLAGCAAAYLVAPNLHPDEPALVTGWLGALREAGVGRVGYHSVASPYAPTMPHHLGKATAEDAVRRSGLAWTILQPGAYLQNLDLTADLVVPYDVHAPFGFLDLADLGAAVATVLLGDGHVGATYELASRQASVAELADEAGVRATRGEWHGGDLPGRERGWLRAMFDHYDRHGLPVGTGVLRWLLAEGARSGGGVS